MSCWYNHKSFIGESRPTWSVTLDPIFPGGPYTIKVTYKGASSIELTDVLFGDVWVCSGQSNMQFFVNRVRES